MLAFIAPRMRCAYIINKFAPFCSMMFTTLLLSLLHISPALAAGTLGWVEHVRLSPGDVTITAKIDTGADTSSLHCDCEPPYELNGEQRIRFSTKDINGKRVNFDTAVVRVTKIKRHSGESQTRFVVRMGLCIGNEFAETEISLVDRSGFNYSMLIGRNFLAGRFVVDASRRHVTAPSCNVNSLHLPLHPPSHLPEYIEQAH